MTRPIRFLSGPICLGAVAIAATTGLAIPQAQAGFDLGGSADFDVLCTCGNLNFTRSNVVGNIGIADQGAFVGSGSGTVTGTVEFFGPDNSAGPSRFSPDGISVIGGSAFNVTNVQTGINALNALSQSLRNEGGTSQLITAGGSINASAGMLDSNGNEIFTATINPNFTPGTTFTINGSSSQSVVFNTTTGGVPFDGRIVLMGGITSDQVLFNFDAGNYDTNTGGETLMMDNALSPTTGTYLDPNGAIEISNSVVDGRIFGGPTDFGITDSTINAPPGTPATISEPISLALFGAALFAFGIIRGRQRAPLLARS